MSNTNVIRIESNIPIPTPRVLGSSKYSFMKEMEVGDSFEIDSSNTDFSPASVRSYAYNFKEKVSHKLNYKFVVRVTRGTGKRPKAIRVWRVQ